jgi:hypothetical protein
MLLVVWRKRPKPCWLDGLISLMTAFEATTKTFGVIFFDFSIFVKSRKGIKIKLGWQKLHKVLLNLQRVWFFILVILVDYLLELNMAAIEIKFNNFCQKVVKVSILISRKCGVFILWWLLYNVPTLYSSKHSIHLIC